MPGDLIIFNATSANVYGHVALVDGGKVNHVEQNASTTGRGTLSISGSTLSGGVRGVEHSPSNRSSAGSIVSVGLLGQWNRWNSGDHSALIGTPPAGAVLEGTYGDLLSVQVAGTSPLYSCNVGGGDEFTSAAANCEGQRISGLLGYIYDSPPAAVPTRAIYRCNTGRDHFDSIDASCEGQHIEGRLGYAIAQD